MSESSRNTGSKFFFEPKANAACRALSTDNIVSRRANTMFALLDDVSQQCVIAALQHGTAANHRQALRSSSVLGRKLANAAVTAIKASAEWSTKCS